MVAKEKSMSTDTAGWPEKKDLLTTWWVRSLVCLDEPSVSFSHFTFYACSHSFSRELQGFLSVSSVTKQPITEFSSTFFAISVFFYIFTLSFGYPHKSLVCRQRHCSFFRWLFSIFFFYLHRSVFHGEYLHHLNKFVYSLSSFLWVLLLLLVVYLFS